MTRKIVKAVFDEQAEEVVIGGRSVFRESELPPICRSACPPFLLYLVRILFVALMTHYIMHQPLQHQLPFH